jgi:hypothetical protein
MQPVDGFQWKRIEGTVDGTATVIAEPTLLHSIIIGENKTGTVTFYDDDTTTTAAQYMFAVQNTCGSIGHVIIVDAQCKKGLTYKLGGTADMMVTYK